MRNRAAWAGVLFAALLGVGGGTQGDHARIIGVRFGQHPSFDRIVIEIDREAPAVYVPTAEKAETIIEIAARPPRRLRPLPAGLRRIHTLKLEPTEGGTRVEIVGRGGPVRTFLLASPARLIVDLADLGSGPLAMPGDVKVLPYDVGGLRALGPPEPTPAEPEPTLEPETEPTVEPEPAAGPPPGEPELGGEPEPPPPEPEGLPPPPGPIVPVPEEPPVSPYDRWLALAIWVGGPFLLVILGVYLTRGRRRARRHVPEERAPESITAAEVFAASDRLDLLEKRIDEEVRARMNLERRFVEVQEDLKVVRDRIGRLARRGEDA